MDLIHYIPNANIEKVEGSTLYYNDHAIKSHNIICATGYRPTINHFKSVQLKIHQQTKFPLVNDNCAARGIKNLYFAGPLGYTGLSSLFIHGFIKSIPATVAAIKDQLLSVGRRQ